MLSSVHNGEAAPSPLLTDLLARARESLINAQAILSDVRDKLLSHLAHNGKVNAKALDTHQFSVHGYAWLATYVTALEQMLNWGERLTKIGRFTERDQLIIQIAFGEYLSQIKGGWPMSQGEMVRLSDFGLDGAAVKFDQTLLSIGNSAAARARLADFIAEGEFGETTLDDESLIIVRDQFHAFTSDHVEAAHQWHLKDELIPLDVIQRLAEMGVFGLTVPEEFGGSGMSKLAMCIVTEELSRGYIGLGSLGTRSEIAAELIRLGGTEAQKQKWLPKIASGEILPTAVFTEPNTGSDLGSLRTRAAKDGDTYHITGSKTWITHASRTDIMTLLARTDPGTSDYRGLSMFLAEKPRGTVDKPFPAKGMTGSEIGVLGYRGMKEYELGFDDFEVKSENLLGAKEGEGFKQLMATFESARIQTAARAVGVAQCAMELGLKYAKERIQFGVPIYRFPRIHGKLAWMAVETMMARQLTYFAAGEKDSGRRCDIPAGMAKLLSARVAWSNADNSLQIHGGNGYAQEYKISRVLCDARILSIFEGAAEIQAQVIARGLLSGRH